MTENQAPENIHVLREKGLKKPDTKTRTRLRGMGYEVTLHIYEAEFEDEFGEIESDRVIETCHQHELVDLVDAYTSDE